MASTAPLKSITISIPPVSNFHKLSEEQAADVLYNQVVPACEAQQIFLAGCGNCNAKGSKWSIEEYQEGKAKHQLFNVKRIQSIFAAAESIIKITKTSTSNSYELKKPFERMQQEYLTNGELIAAMLLKGHQACFGSQTENLNVNADFQLKAIVQFY